MAKVDKPLKHQQAHAGWPQLIAVLGVVVYVFGFYLLEYLLKPIPIKCHALSWLLIPDELARQWVGGHPDRFGLLDRFPILLGTAAILSSGYLLGRLLLDWLAVDCGLNRLERLLISLGVGLSLLSLGTLMLGLLGLSRQPWPLFAGGSVLVLVSLLRYGHRRPENSDQSVRTPCKKGGTSLAWAALLMCGPFVLVILLGGMLPPWQFDVREYHLQVPKEWYLAGRAEFLAHNVYGNMPLGAEMHALLGMSLMQGWKDWWWGALVGKTVIASFGPLTAAAVYMLGTRFFCRTAGAVGAFALISTPWIGHVSMAGLIEGGYAFYAILAIHVTLLANQQGSWALPPAQQSNGRPGSLAWLAGFLAGSAVACKYPALLFVVAPLMIWNSQAAVGKLRCYRLAVFALGVACACGLWFGKNWLQTGNPTYPLLSEWFDSRTRTPEKDAQWSRAHRTPANGLGPGQLASSLTTTLVTSDYLSPVLFPLALIGLLSPKHRRVTWPLAGILLFVFGSWWLLTHRVDRFLVPLMPLVAVLAGVGSTWSSSVVWRRTVLVLLCWGFAVNLVFVSSRAVSDNRFLVSLSELRPDRESPHDEGYFHLHRTHDVINQTVQPGFAVLMVGEAQVFNLEVPALYNTCFDDCLFEQLMKGRTRQQRLDALRRHRISHVFIFWRELERYREPGNYGYSDYVTRDRIHREFVDEQALLRPIPIPGHASSSELFEVTGWRSWSAPRTSN